MKKNLMFLTLLISVLMLSVVSAGITGYLVRGGTLNTDGYKATLQKVDSSGVASISVQTPSGATEVVRVGKDETAQVGEIQIKVSGLRSGNLFTRSGANIQLTPAPTPANIKLVGAGAVGSGATTHTHLSDYEVVWVEFMNITGYNSSLHSAFYNPDVPKPLYPSLGDGSGEIRINGDQNGKLLQFVGECPQNKIVINAGYSLFGYNIYNSAAVISENYDDEVYYLTIEEPFGFSNAEEDNERIDRVSLRLSCARVEPTLHNFSLDY